MSVRQWWTLVTASALVVVIGGAAAFFLTQNAPPAFRPRSLPVTAPSVTPSVPAQASPGAVTPVSRSQPMTLSIPAIGVHSAVLPPAACCGVLTDGTLQTPPLSGSQADEVGWWKGGFAPGQGGPAILVGHINSAAMGNLVFARLGELKPGDTATITLADGITVTFTVTAKQEVSKSTGPFWTGFWQSAQAAGTPTLRLITCGGAFNPATGHYEDNLLIYLNETSVS
jgi:hypothetical protein